MPEQKTKYYWAMVHLKKQNAKLLKDIKNMKFWGVTHQCFATDHISYTTTAVQAPTKKDALYIFNLLAEKRKEYPYMWNTVTLENVEELDIITEKTV